MTNETNALRSKHTKGPWTLGDENDSHFEIEIGDSNTCASICRFDRHTGKAAFSREEMIANGNLIIAAPSLLEALELAANRIERLQLECAESSNIRSNANEWIQEARAIIGKAKGMPSHYYPWKMEQHS